MPGVCAGCVCVRTVEKSDVTAGSQYNIDARIGMQATPPQSSYCVVL